MSDSAPTVDARVASSAGSPANRKTTLAQATAIGTGSAGGAATLLWAIGCLKGHQFYSPDDALALFWAGMLTPAAMALWQKFNHWAGADA